jgi:hypothetical protein
MRAIIEQEAAVVCGPLDCRCHGGGGGVVGDPVLVGLSRIGQHAIIGAAIYL